MTVQAQYIFKGTPAEFNYDARPFAHRVRSTHFPAPFIYETHLENNSFQLSIIVGEASAIILAQTEPDGQTSITVESSEQDWPIVAPWWEKLHAELSRSERFAKAKKADKKPPAERITADEVIRRFYRRKKYNPDLQLKDICTEFNISYAYVRKRKNAFDKQRKPRKDGNISE